MGTRFFSLASVDLWVRTSGHGSPAVLVHGSWDDHTAWSRVAAQLATTHHVTSYDRRGHGRSTCPPGQGTIRQDVHDLRGLLVMGTDGPVHLVGHSYGASIAVVVAQHHPELLRSLTVHEPPLFSVLAGRPEFEHRRRRLRDAMADAAALVASGHREAGARLFAERVTLQEGDRFFDELTPDVRATWTANAHTWLDQYRDPDRLAVDPTVLGETRVPVLATRGSRTRPEYMAIVEVLAAATPHARLEVVSGAGHFPHLTHADAYADVVRRFLWEVDQELRCMSSSS